MGIFTKTITNWNQLSPGYPDKSITLILVADPDASAIFTSVLQLDSSNVGFSSGYALPLPPLLPFSSPSHLPQISSQAQTITSVNQTSYSIGIVGLNYGVFATVSVASFTTPNGSVFSRLSSPLSSFSHSLTLSLSHSLTLSLSLSLSFSFTFETRNIILVNTFVRCSLHRTLQRF